MSDLSIPREAADWAQAWLRDAATVSYEYQKRPDVIAHRHERAVVRIERAIAGLEASPAQRARCAVSIGILRDIVLRER